MLGYEVDLMLTAVHDIIVETFDADVTPELLENVCDKLNRYLGYYGIATFEVKDTNKRPDYLPYYEIVQVEENK